MDGLLLFAAQKTSNKHAVCRGFRDQSGRARGDVLGGRGPPVWDSIFKRHIIYRQDFAIPPQVLRGFDLNFPSLGGRREYRALNAPAASRGKVKNHTS
jgi:hypothetical protein